MGKYFANLGYEFYLGLGTGVMRKGKREGRVCNVEDMNRGKE